MMLIGPGRGDRVGGGTIALQNPTGVDHVGGGEHLASTVYLLEQMGGCEPILVSFIIIGNFFFFLFIRSSDYDGEVRVGVIIPL